MSTQSKKRKRKKQVYKPFEPVPIPASDTSPFLTVAEVASIERKVPKTIYRRCEDGVYSYKRDHGGQILIYRTTFEEQLAARSVSARCPMA